MSEKAIPSNGISKEFIFRFDFRSNEHHPIYSDPLVEMVREQICNLLDFVIFTSENREVKVDGFKFLNDLTVTYRLFNKKR